MPNINSVSFTFHDERKREEYGPMKKAEATISAAVAEGEDGAAVLDAIAFIATNKVRAALTIEGAAAPKEAATAALPVAAAATAASPSKEPAAPAVAASPTTASASNHRIRRTQDEMNRGLSVEQAIAERAAAAGSQPATQEASSAPPASTDGPTAAEPQADAPAADEWDATVSSPAITDAEMSVACSEAASRLGEGGGAQVRDVKERFNPTPGQPFTVRQIPQDQRRLFLDQVAAL